jgi:hypothetical protein
MRGGWRAPKWNAHGRECGTKNKIEFRLFEVCDIIPKPENVNLSGGRIQRFNSI